MIKMKGEQLLSNELTLLFFADKISKFSETKMADKLLFSLY